MHEYLQKLDLLSLSEDTTDTIPIDIQPELLLSIKPGENPVQIHPAGHQILQKKDGAIIVSVFGMNPIERYELLKKLCKKPIWETLEPITSSIMKGLIILGTVELPTKSIVLVDLYEQQYIDGTLHDEHLLMIAATITSVFLYVHNDEITLSTLNMLEPLANLTQLLGPANMPAMLWLVNDPSNASTTSCYSTLPELLLNQEKQKHFPPTSKSIAYDLLQLRQLGTWILSMDSLDISSMFLLQLFKNTTTKATFGHALTSSMLCKLLQVYVGELNREHTVDFVVCWKSLIQSECNAVAEEALKTYSDCMSDLVYTVPPLGEEDFIKYHEEMLVLAMDMYHADAPYNTSERRAIKKHLRGQIDQERCQVLQLLHHSSLEYNRTQQQDLLTAYTQRIAECSTFESFRHLLGLYFDDCRNKMAGTKVLESVMNVYEQDLAQLFHLYEKDRMQENHKTEFEEQKQKFEEEFQEQKAKLQQHFESQQSLVQSSVYQKTELAEKLTAAAQAKLKANEKHTKQLASELQQQRNANLELQQKLLILEHQAQQEKKLREKQSAETHQAEVKLTQQRTANEELRTILKQTISTLEEKEQQHQLDLQAQAASTNTRMEQLQEQTHRMNQTLKIATDEREQLQLQLNDLYCKIAGLPPSIQQHFVTSSSPDDAIAFADVLTNFMDN